MYDLTMLKNAVGITGIMDFLVSITKNQFFGFLLVAIFLIMLGNLRRYGIEAALMTGSYLCFVLSIPLAYIHYVSFYYTIFFLTVAAFSTMYAYVAKPSMG